MAAAKERLDKLILDRGLVTSRERAKAFIMEGKVLVNGSASHGKKLWIQSQGK